MILKCTEEFIAFLASVSSCMQNPVPHQYHQRTNGLCSDRFSCPQDFQWSVEIRLKPYSSACLICTKPHCHCSSHPQCFSRVLCAAEYFLFSGNHKSYGAEYHLLPDMIASGIIVRFRNFWCQFHPGLVKDSDQIYEYICNEIGNREHIRYFDMLWDCYPTAVAWRNNDN